MCNYVASWTAKGSWFDYRQVWNILLQSVQIGFQPIQSFIKCMYRVSSLADKAAGAWSWPFTSPSVPKLGIRENSIPTLPSSHSTLLSTSKGFFFCSDPTAQIGSRPHCRGFQITHTHTPYKTVFLNRRAAARYRALASIIPARERFYRNLSF